MAGPAPKERRRSDALVRAFVVVGAIVLALGIAEASLHLLFGNLGMPRAVIGPPDGRCSGLKPDTTVEYTGWGRRIPAVIHDVNPLGFRGPTIDQAKDPGVFRILVLGDSFVYGVGVASDQALPAQLGRLLAETRGPTIEVLNFGIPGLNIEEVVEQYTRFAAGWQHDLVLLSAHHNDLSGPLCEMVGRATRFWFVKNVLLFRQVHQLFSERDRDYVRRIGDPVGRIGRAMDVFLATSRVAHARFGVFLVDRPQLVGAPDGAVEQAATARSIPYLILQPEGQAIDKIPRDGHFSAAGNTEAARRLARWLEEEGMLPDSTTPPAS